MKFINKNWEKLVLLTYSLILPTVSFAQLTIIPSPAPTSSSTSSGTIVNPIPNITSISGLIQTLLTGFLKIGIPIVALAIIYCGFLFVKAQGKPEEITKAKDALLYTVIGAAILLGAWAIAQMISSTVLAL